MATLYADRDVLLFPAMHDSGGMVILEARIVASGRLSRLADPRPWSMRAAAMQDRGKSVAQVVREMGDALIGLRKITTSACPGSGAALRDSLGARR
jgi:hypothetical protein